MCLVGTDWSGKTLKLLGQSCSEGRRRRSRRACGRGVGKEEEEEEKGEHFVVGFFLQAGIGIMAEAVVEMEVDVGDLGATVVVNRFSVNGMCMCVCVRTFVFGVFLTLCGRSYGLGFRCSCFFLLALCLSDVHKLDTFSKS